MNYRRFRLGRCLRAFGNELFEVLSRSGDIHLNHSGGRLRFGGSRHDDHDISVLRERIDVRGEVRVAHFHSLELGVGFEARYFELLDDVGDTFEPMTIILLRATQYTNTDDLSY